MVIPKAPFPSFALALSRQSSQATNDPEDTPPQERGAELDLMKTFDQRMPDTWNMAEASDEDKSDTETVFEVRDPEEKKKSGRDTNSSSSTRAEGKKTICLPNLSGIFRLLICCSVSTSSEGGEMQR